jgi:Lrp/AsnC family transcriptional regulator
MPVTFDRIDKKIMQVMQTDASFNVGEIAKRVGLSTSPCWRRINRLLDSGVIKKRVAILDQDLLGINVMVFAEVRLAAHGRQALPNFQQAVKKLPEVLECYTLLGDVDFLLKIVTKDIHTYEKFLHRLLSLPTVREVSSRMVVSEIKCTTELPLDLAS